ncbi:MAG: hypothetical protein HY862_17810 [Chloroflexi bacterium]|nr:hypothetical protein [Chloroflexota bacterium]
MTRTFEEKKRVLELWAEGQNKLQIAKETGIPRGTVSDCIVEFGNLENFEQHYHQKKLSNAVFSVQDAGRLQIQKAYAYLLGMYLGDGTVSKIPKTYKLRIFLDSRYPHIINSCAQAMQTILPENKIGILPQKGNYVTVQCHSNTLIDLFPQFGNGRKHDRPIILMGWQQEIVDQYPLEFFRGLYHSDGSRFSSVIKGKDYPKYQFTNMSEDIRQMFIHACELLELHWTTKTSKRDIMISRREDVTYLDSVIGPKS